ncbi:YdeI/OmpD-associated family protein [Mucilaginibacter sp. HMF5004]|uniref:YdeI/OmpD-associated family protein n=1 Tax=Mucilaginibacter rivuli TaxID=2857527 RepID=UPI001C5D61AD|nr:DUF1801 domain-containing protein [Mucilaginibacter rivuli]MBW4888781.1 YdeI/OmpD-associated family protein [Mucilaginibacter rivuli]
MENVDPRIDAYIAKSADFAKPILTHLRQLVHNACPGIEETMKWSCPFFDYKGPLCQMVAFKQHMGFGFWKATAMADPNKIFKSQEESSAGSIGKITSMAQLPPDEVLIAYIKEAVALNESGVKLPTRTTNKTPVVKAALITPPEFITMLEGNSMAKMHFEEFSPSKRKEYIEWFVDAKTEATKQKRMDQALEWISEGKSRHWKYQNC